MTAIPTLTSRLLALIPAAIGQAYLFWLVVSGQLDYAQVAITIVIEGLLALTISVLLAPNGRTAASRLFMLVIIALCQAMVLMAMFLMPVQNKQRVFEQ